MTPIEMPITATFLFTLLGLLNLSFFFIFASLAVRLLAWPIRMLVFSIKGLILK